jgi:hypothetical protein
MNPTMTIALVHEHQAELLRAAEARRIARTERRERFVLAGTVSGLAHTLGRLRRGATGSLEPAPESCCA